MKSSSHLKDLSCVRKYDFYLFDLTTQKLKACCRTPFLPSTQSITEDLEAILNQRKELRSGIKASGCDTCWKLEDAGHQSYRTQQPYEATQNIDLEAHAPFLIEFVTSNACNLRCVYCGPQHSSQWVKGRSKTEGRLSPEIKHWVKKWWPSVGRFQIIGGEPTISPDTFEVIDFLSELCQKMPPKEKKHLFIISNLAISSTALKRFIERLGPCLEHFEVDIAVSAEALGTQFEFIRDGSDFKVFEENFISLIENRSLNMTVLSTLSVLSIGRYHQFLAWMTDKLITHNRPFQWVYSEVVNPNPLSPRRFPQSLSKEYHLALHSLESIPKELIRMPKFFEESKAALTDLYQSLPAASNFSEVTSFLDRAEGERLRPLNWKVEFPELAAP